MAATEFPPTKEELIPVLEQIVILVAAKQDTVSQSRLDQILEFIRFGMNSYSNIKTIARQELDNALEEKEFQSFRPDSTADAARLGRRLHARYIGQLRLTMQEARLEKGVDRFIANANFIVFAAESGQTLFSGDIQYDSSNLRKSLQRLAEHIQIHFPIKAFILETRGDRQVAKISVGRSLGVELDRQFHVHERTVEHTMAPGSIRKRISYSQEVIALVRVIRVMENESWVSVPEKERGKIKLGQVLFSQPE